MDLKSGYPFWAIKNGLMHAFEPLQRDVRCEVAVIGGGITGALIADELAAHGHEVVVVEQRDIGWGSTSASTALLQYEIDTHLVELAERYGEADAVLAYRACAEAIGLVGERARAVRDVDFGPMRSLYWASRRRDVDPLQAECALRARHGFDVSWLDAGAVREEFGLAAPGAILSALAARVDPYRLAYRLFMRLQRNGTAIHDRTRVDEVEATSRRVRMRTASGCRIEADYAVVAAGYASQHWLKETVARNRSSYAIITDPLPDGAAGGLADTMAWESARPYLYLRTTGDGRLLVGGEDDAVDIPARRDKRVHGKARTLVKHMHRALPLLPVVPAFSWAGTFAETEDGLPYFGAHEQRGPRVLFAMAYGGNGITYSMLGAGLLRATIERRAHPLKTLFGFARRERR
ncbi:NAD(P)/FAD-dependent oxidoreductase [Cognatilysobacter tabacisoli]|uniref:NAD(P)/FAD-dependent oxidoreductase n=1 Tax=Cognatilysobacter tabacisoli TaxID=2315424 RepID=UPI000E6B1DB7|nr:FAD-dependent oxidoreductase [Lysobacter tabacisoli]